MSKGYDLDYIWKHVDRGATKDAASYYIQASENGGEPPGRWWGPGARALGFEPGQRVEREPYDLLFGERKAPDGMQLARLADLSEQTYVTLQVIPYSAGAHIGLQGGFAIADLPG